MPTTIKCLHPSSLRATAGRSVKFTTILFRNKLQDFIIYGFAVGEFPVRFPPLGLIVHDFFADLWMLRSIPFAQHTLIMSFSHFSSYRWRGAGFCYETAACTVVGWHREQNTYGKSFPQKKRTEKFNRIQVGTERGSRVVVTMQMKICWSNKKTGTWGIKLLCVSCSHFCTEFIRISCDIEFFALPCNPPLLRKSFRLSFTFAFQKKVPNPLSSAACHEQETLVLIKIKFSMTNRWRENQLNERAPLM